ncbi:MAG: hypothetical protein MHPSP_000826, partial [Paramarteilia canceri]
MNTFLGFNCSSKQSMFNESHKPNGDSLHKTLLVTRQTDIEELLLSTAEKILSKLFVLTEDNMQITTVFSIIITMIIVFLNMDQKEDKFVKGFKNYLKKIDSKLIDSVQSLDITMVKDTLSSFYYLCDDTYSNTNNIDD